MDLWVPVNISRQNEMTYLLKHHAPAQAIQSHSVNDKVKDKVTKWSTLMMSSESVYSRSMHIEQEHVPYIKQIYIRT